MFTISFFKNLKFEFLLIQISINSSTLALIISKINLCLIFLYGEIEKYFLSTIDSLSINKISLRFNSFNNISTSSSLSEHNLEISLIIKFNPKLKFSE